MVFKVIPSKDKVVKGYVKSPDTFKQHAVALKKLLNNYQPPYILAFYFVRRTKARFDFGNGGVELLADLFTAYNVWEDDNCDCFLPVPWIVDGSCYKVDAKNPGVYIKVVKKLVYE